MAYNRIEKRSVEKCFLRQRFQTVLFLLVKCPPFCLCILKIYSLTKLSLFGNYIQNDSKTHQITVFFFILYADFSNFICVLYLYLKKKKKAGEIAVFTLATEPH